MADMVLTRIRVGELGKAELLLLTRMCRMGYNGLNPEELMRREIRGQVQFWKTEKALFVLGLDFHPEGKELVVQGFAGEGVIKDRKQIMEDLEGIALKEGCRWIGGFGEISKGHQWLYEGLGMKPWAVYYYKELGDVPSDAA